MHRSDDVTLLTAEYSAAVNCSQDDGTIKRRLVKHGDWTESGAEELLYSLSDMVRLCCEMRSHFPSCWG